MMDYYRATKWQRRVSDCWTWWHHNLNKGTPAMIVRDRFDKFAVFRGPVLGDCISLKPEKPLGKIVASWRAE